MSLRDLLKTYRITEVQGDRYGGAWPRDRFREHGISYETAAKPKSDLYQDLLPAINSHMVDLLDDASPDCAVRAASNAEPREVAATASIMRRNAHDDLANAVAGVVSMLATDANEYDESLSIGCSARAKTPTNPIPNGSNNDTQTSSPPAATEARGEKERNYDMSKSKTTYINATRRDR